MNRYATKDCDCPDVVIGTGGKRPEKCREHDNRYLSEAQLRSVGVDAGSPPSERGFSGSFSPASGPAGTPGLGVDSSTPRRRNDSFASETGRKESARKLRPAKRRSEPKRDWSLAITKVEEESCCRICKRSNCKLDAAHVLGREHDEPKVGTDGRPLKELWVHPDRIIPACGPFPNGCHGDIDFHRINYMGYLTLSEQLRAVEDAGGIAEAYRALMPVERREEVERSAAA